MMKTLIQFITAWFKMPGNRLLKSAIILFVPVILLLALGGLVNRFDPSFNPDKAMYKMYPGDYLVVIGVGGFIAWTWLRLIWLKIQRNRKKKHHEN